MVRDTRTREQLLKELAECRRKIGELEESFAAPDGRHTALADGEERLRRSFDPLHVGVAVVDTKGRWLDVNRKVCSMLQYSREELNGMTWLDLTSNEELAWELEALEVLFRGEKDVIVFEKHYIRRDGSLVPAVISLSPVRNARGEVDRLVAVIEDVGERKRIEETLGETERRYRELADSLSHIVIELDGEGNVTFLNEKGCKVSGYTRKEIDAGLSIYRIVAPEDHSKLTTRIKKTAKGVPLRGNVYTGITKNGVRFPVEAYSYPVVRDNVIVGYRVNVMDVMERGRMGEDPDVISLATRRESGTTQPKPSAGVLRKDEGVLRAIIDGSPMPTFVIDRDHRVIHWNRALEELTGVRSEAMVGTDKHLRLFYREERPCLADLLLDGNTSGLNRLYPGGAGKSNLIQGAYEVVDLIWIKGKEEKWLHLTAATIKDPKGDIIGAIETLEDLTELTGALEALRSREKDLEAKSVSLEEAYTALKVLLQRKEADKENLENSVLANVRDMVFPYLDKLENTRPSEKQKLYLTIMRANLNEIVSPFLQKVSAIESRLTPTELQVAQLIKGGRSSKEIAEALGVGTGTVETHRKNIRAKLGLSSRKVNLHGYLHSLK